MAQRLKGALLALAAGLLAAACSGPAVIGGDVFDLHRSAVLAYDAGEDAKAEALYQGLARAAPGDPETWLRLGNLYARHGKPDDAADAYQHALLLNPADNRLWYNLGVIRQRQAGAAYIRANELSDKKDPLYERTLKLSERLAAPPAADVPPVPTPEAASNAAK